MARGVVHCVWTSGHICIQKAPRRLPGYKDRGNWCTTKTRNIHRVVYIFNFQIYCGTSPRGFDAVANPEGSRRPPPLQGPKTKISRGSMPPDPSPAYKCQLWCVEILAKIRPPVCHFLDSPLWCNQSRNLQINLMLSFPLFRPLNSSKSYKCCLKVADWANNKPDRSQIHNSHLEILRSIIVII